MTTEIGLVCYSCGDTYDQEPSDVVECDCLFYFIS